MRTSEAYQTIVMAIRNGLRVLLVGEPGVGKSDMVAQAARQEGVDLILSHPAVEDPTDVRGVYWVVDGRVVALPHDALRRATTATSPTIWFLDDLGQASSSTQAAYMQLILAGRLGEHTLSEHVTIFAATNRRTSGMGVSGILAPVQDRFDIVLPVEADVESWQTWSARNDIDPRIVAFLHLHPNELLVARAGGDIAASPSPRSWASADRLLKLGADPSLAVGQATGIALKGFLQNIGAMPDVDAILASGTVPKELGPDIMYAVMTSITARMSPATWPSIADVIESLADDREPWAVLLFRMIARLDSGLESHGGAALARLASGKCGQIMFG